MCVCEGAVRGLLLERLQVKLTGFFSERAKKF